MNSTTTTTAARTALSRGFTRALRGEGRTPGEGWKAEAAADAAEVESQRLRRLLPAEAEALAALAAARWSPWGQSTLKEEAVKSLLRKEGAGLHPAEWAMAVRIAGGHGPCREHGAPALPGEEILAWQRVYARLRLAAAEAMVSCGLQAEGNLTAGHFAHAVHPALMGPVVRLWKATAQRPGVAGSSYNYPPGELNGLLSHAHPMWARAGAHGERVLVRLITAVGVRRAARYAGRPGKGGIGRLATAVRAWRWEKDLPRAIAERVGKMPTWKRIGARAAWREISGLSAEHGYQQAYPPLAARAAGFHREGSGGAKPQDGAASRNELMAAFWTAFRAQLALGRNAVLEAAGAVKAAAAAQFRGADWAGAVKPLLAALEAAQPQCDRGSPEAAARSARLVRTILQGTIPLKAFGEALAGLVGKVAEHDRPGLALRLVATFGRQWRQWVQFAETTEAPSGSVVHDWTHFLPGGRRQGLGDYLLRHRRALTQASAAVVASLWDVATAADRELGPTKFISAVKAAEMERANAWMASAQQKELLHEAIAWNHEIHSEEKYLAFERRWTAALEVAPVVDPERRWKAASVVGRFLPRNDPRGLFLGNHTGCCQHPNGAGATCAWFGHESPRSGFFVVEAGQKVLAQSWAWISDDGALVLDSVEGYSSYGASDGKAVAEVYAMMAKDLAGEVRTVEVSTHIRVAAEAFQAKGIAPPQGWVFAPVPRGYSGYTDAHGARLVLAHCPEAKGWQHPEAQPAAPAVASTFAVRGATSADLPVLETIAAAVYPQGWQFVSIDESCSGMVLEKDGVPVGYAILDEAGREVQDLAVLPQYRATRGLRSLTDALLTRVRTVGGKWRAVARETTSLRMLRGMARRKQLLLTEHGSTDTMGDDAMVSVSFTAL